MIKLKIIYTMVICLLIPSYSLAIGIKQEKPASKEKPVARVLKKGLYLAAAGVAASVIAYLCKAVYESKVFPYKVFGPFRAMPKAIAIELNNKKDKDLHLNEFSPELQSEILNCLTKSYDATQRPSMCEAFKMFIGHFTIKFTDDAMYYSCEDNEENPNDYAYPFR